MFKFFLSLAQVGFVLINALSDMGMEIFSYGSFMKDKVHGGGTEATDSQALINPADPS
jgi:hypothetical protein